MANRVQPATLETREHLIMELGGLLDRVAGLLRILAEEIVVFDYLNEKYRQEDPNIESL